MFMTRDGFTFRAMGFTGARAAAYKEGYINAFPCFIRKLRYAAQTLFWGGIMPMFIVSYDLKETDPDPHQTFLEKAKEHGWKLWIKGKSGTSYRLPNTTLEGSFDTRAEAVTALKATRNDTAEELGIKVTMEKWIVAEYSGSTFDSDKKK